MSYQNTNISIGVRRHRSFLVIYKGKMDRKFIVAMILSLVTVWGMQYFFSKKNPANTAIVGGAASVGASNQQSTGGSVAIPASPDLLKPLNTEVIFLDDEKIKHAVLTQVETALFKADFSTHGATLTSLMFKKHLGKNKTAIQTVDNQNYRAASVQFNSNFMIALNDATPYGYELADNYIRDDIHYLVYRAYTADWIIKKTFAIAENSYQIDLTVACEPRHEGAQAIKPRILFDAPYMHELGEDDSISCFMYNEQQRAIERKDAGSESGTVWYWQNNQVIFGAYNRYFAHALMKDADHFAQRAYFKRFDAQHTWGILEGSTIAEKKEWTMSFFCGPKVYDHLAATGTPLPDILNFGWMSSICKWILKLLEWLSKHVGNFGLAIILFTMILRLPIMPMTIYGRIKSEEYNKHSATIARIRAKYKDDMAMQQQELMRYYKDHKLSPAAPVIGCLPMLFIQAPVMYCLYTVLSGCLDLYQSPFLGWLIDLSAKDPFYVLPVLMGISMVWSQTLVASDDRQRTIMLFASLVMSVVSASWPAGLVLYFVTNNFLSVGEEYLRKYVTRTKRALRI